jgi:ATP synthase protein I
MNRQDVAILRGAALPTAATAVVLVVVAGLLAGLPGVLGAVFGVGVVAVFFSVGILAIGAAARVSPLMMLNVALLTYLVKIILLAVLLVAFKDTTAFDTKAFAWSILVSTLVWIAAEMRTFSRQRILYVDPDQGVTR